MVARFASFPLLQTTIIRPRFANGSWCAKENRDLRIPKERLHIQPTGPNWNQRNERLSRYRTRQLLIRSIWHKSWHVCEFNNHVVLIAPYSRQSKSILSPPHQGRCSLEWWGLPGGYIVGDCDFRWYGFELLMALRAIHCTFDRLVCDCTRYSIYCCVASDA